jgi:predicted PurR-regulated permease PerM
MKDILKTQKSVQYYVWYNLAMILFSFMLGIFFAFAYNPDITVLKEKINHNQMILVAIIAVLIVSAIVVVGLFWLFYKLLYGILLKKLTRNYEELKKIDL